MNKIVLKEKEILELIRSTAIKDTGVLNSTMVLNKDGMYYESGYNNHRHRACIYSPDLEDDPDCTVEICIKWLSVDETVEIKMIVFYDDEVRILPNGQSDIYRICLKQNLSEEEYFQKMLVNDIFSHELYQELEKFHTKLHEVYIENTRTE